MSRLDAQLGYWNGEGAGKTFSHPLPLDELRVRLTPQAAILDYGCGYGRAASLLARAGFSRVTGVDIAEALLARGRREHPDLDLRLVHGLPLPFPDASFDACLLVAVLTCVPTEAGAEALMAEAARLLRPGGLLLLSDYPLQADARNIARYRRDAAEFGVYGAFRTGGAVCRHFAPERLEALLRGFEPLWRRDVDVPTMNGNPARITQVMARAGGA